ncbi:MAG: TIGR01459 family HAD-type hydrolase [Hyphomicrobium sp.]
MPSDTSSSQIPIVASLKSLINKRSALLVDIWGVMHNGVRPFLAAAEACACFRNSGGTVLLLSNSPRPTPSVLRQLEAVGVPSSAFDSVLTSGDTALLLIEKSAKRGQKLAHIGPERDLGLFSGIHEKLVPLKAAHTVVCSGLFDDETEGPENYTEMLSELASRRVPMICANPDIMVERGGRIIYCAGAVAKAYEAHGGVVDYVGKPYLPIYKLAFERLAKLRNIKEIPSSEVLAIGDGVGTDIEGAHVAGIDAVFIASGLHADARRGLDRELLEKLFSKSPNRPIAAMQELKW